MPTEARNPDFVPPSFADPSAGRIVLLADDLTGACDAGAAFLRAGRSVRVWFGSSVQFSSPGVRAGLQHQFARRFRPVAQPASSPAPPPLSARDPNSLFFKKVDSAGSRPSCRRSSRRASRSSNARRPACSRLSRRRSHRSRRHPGDSGCGGTALAQIRLAQPLSAHGSQPHLQRLPRRRELAPHRSIPAKPSSSATAQPKPISKPWSALRKICPASSMRARPAWRRRSPA